MSSKWLSWRPPKLAPNVSRILRIAGMAIAVFGLAVLPWIIGDSSLYLVSSIAAMFIAAAGLNFISGYAGQGSLGQAGFIGIGAYVYALLEVRVGAPSDPRGARRRSRPRRPPAIFRRSPPCGCRASTSR